MDPISIAIGLSKVAPIVANWLGGDKAEKAANTVVDIAETITGQKGKDALDVINADPNLALEFQKAILKDKYRLDELYLGDKADARSMYKIQNQQADKISERIMKWNLYAVLGLVGLNGAAIYFLGDQAAVLAAVSNIFGIVIKSLLDERKEVTGFYFGSSLGSKTKEEKLK